MAFIKVAFDEALNGTLRLAFDGNGELEEMVDRGIPIQHVNDLWERQIGKTPACREVVNFRLPSDGALLPEVNTLDPAFSKDRVANYFAVRDALKAEPSYNEISNPLIRRAKFLWDQAHTQVPHLPHSLTNKLLHLIFNH